MKLEQSIHCVSKGLGGHYVVVLTGNVATIAEFKFLFHEIWSIVNPLHKVLTQRPKIDPMITKRLLHCVYEGTKGYKESYCSISFAKP